MQLVWIHHLVKCLQLILGLVSVLVRVIDLSDFVVDDCLPVLLGNFICGAAFSQVPSIGCLILMLTLLTALCVPAGAKSPRCWCRISPTLPATPTSHSLYPCCSTHPSRGCLCHTPTSLLCWRAYSLARAPVPRTCSCCCLMCGGGGARMPRPVRSD